MRRLFTGVLAVVGFAAAAQAAPSLEFSIGLCAAKTTDKARLACYDAIAARLRTGDVSAVAAPVVPSAPVATAAPVAPAPVIAAPVPAAPTAPVPPPFTAVPAPAAAPTPAPAPAAAAQPAESQFGAESIKKPTAEAGQPQPVDQITGVIKVCTFSPLGRAIITLDNGQVWRQIEGDTERFRGKEGDIATIERSFIGGYNLTTNQHSQMLKVRRVR